MRRLLIISIATCLALCLCASSFAQDAPGDEEWLEFEHRGRMLYRMPNDMMRRLGYDVLDIPDDRNAAMYIMWATDRFKEFDGTEELEVRLRNEPWTAEEFPDAAAWLEENKEAFDLLDMAIMMEEGQFPVFMSRQGHTFLFDSLLPQLRGVRSMTSALHMRAHLHEGEGRADEAREDILRAFRLANKLDEGGLSLIYSLVALAMHHVGIVATQGVLSRDAFSADILEDFQRELSELCGEFPGYQHALEGEEAWSINVFENMVFGGEYIWMIPIYGGRVEEQDEVKKAFIQGRLYRVLTPDRAMRKDFSQYYEVVREHSKQPLWEFEKFPNYIEGARPYNFPYVFLSMLYFPAFDAAFNRYGNMYAQFDALIQVVAVLRYHADHGEYPEELDALVPEYLDELPLDPFTGEPFIYSIEDDGFVVYSVGINREDDGGKTPRDERGADDMAVRIKRD